MNVSTGHNDSYRKSGVDVTAGYKAVELMKKHISRTNIPGVMSGIGSFGGMFEPDLGSLKRPVLVSGTDGVGTKLKIAIVLDKHDSIGIDCVAMCTNDIACLGAKPLFFLDYIACGKNQPEKIASIVSGIAEGCVQSGCALIGGETAEMPGFYPENEYDLAGFSVGIVDYDKIISESKIKNGDVLIGITSSGVHSNGFSLIRNVFEMSEHVLGKHYDDLGASLGETLLTPTKIYVSALNSLCKNVDVHGISHITGGGWHENIPRMLPKNFHAVVNKNSMPKLPIFDVISITGKIPENDMYSTFNMGMGICVAVGAKDADKALAVLKNSGEKCYVIGEVSPGENGVTLC